MRYLIIFLAGIMLATSACRSVQDLVESGDYDRAIDLAVKNLSGKAKKNPDIVAALEMAFNKAQDRDMRAINALKAEGRDENWERILNISKTIGNRQRKVEPLLPLVDKKGYQATFNLIQVEDIKSESKEKTAEYLYERAKRLLDESELTGDKDLAREAFRELVKLNEIYLNYRDVEVLKREAKFMGTSFYLLKVENRSNTVLPVGFHDRLTRWSASDFNSSWREFHVEALDGLNYDYLAQVLIRDIAVSPETVKERQYDESREIEEGFEYVLDSKGNVMKDSLGNDIKVPKKIFIKATVLEVYQHKAALVSGDIEIIDMRTNNIMRSEAITSEAVFENYASTLLGGDKRALSEESKRRLGNRPLPFPSTEAMLLDAAETLKPVLRQKLRRFID